MSEYLITLILAGCLIAAAVIFSDQTVNPAHIAWAENSCSLNSGIHELSADREQLSVRCMNGAVFIAAKSGVKP
mgnify:CR=1 FL=1|tara:strand:- start:7318 stop:7539 length:222 start_codon:yes stop_codon:yes gene_type:complete